MRVDRPKRSQTLLACAALAAATLAAYWQVSGFEFVNYDDNSMLLDNPMVRSGLTLGGISWALSTSWFEYWHPLTWLSHMLDFELFGMKAGGHHLVSLGLHVANTLLLFAVLHRMTRAWKQSAMVAALFALHPLHVESVAWIAERKDVLSAFFFMLTLWAYVRYAEICSREAKPGFTHHALTFPALVFYLLSLSFFALGLMCKPMLVTLPFVLLLLDYWPLRRSQPFWEKLPFFALTVASCAITYNWASNHNLLSAEKVSWGLRLANVPVSYARYLGKMLWPTDLAVPYPMPSHWAGWQTAGAVAVLVLITVGLALRARSARYGLVGWLIFLGVLFPTIRIVQAGDQSIADRYTYIPSIGLFIAAVWSAAEWGRRRTSSRSAVQLAALGTVAVLSLGACFALTRNQLQYWQDSETLFRHALSVTTGNYVAHANLGNALANRGNLPAAEAEFSAALRMQPENYSAMYALANVVRTNHGPEAALELFRKALALRPQEATAHYNHAIALAELGQEGAIAQYREALRLDPKLAPAHNNLAGLLVLQGKAEEGLAHALAALRFKPDFPEAHFHAGNSLFLQERFAEAEAHYRAALKLNPMLAAAHLQLGEVLVNQHKLQAAWEPLTTAARLEPSDPRPLQDLAQVGLALQRPREASEHFRAALRLAPDWAEGMQKLAWLLATHPDPNLRNGVQAVEFALRASALTGRTNVVYQQTLAAAYAEAGMFREAVETQDVVCALTINQRGFVDPAAKQRLEQYRAGQPYREPL